MRMMLIAGTVVAASVGAERGLAEMVPCGGDFGAFVQAFSAEAVAQGHHPSTVANYFKGVQQNKAVLRADRAQGFFQKNFIDFSRAVISKSRLSTGHAKSQELDSLFDQIEIDFGVSRGVLLAFWALETDYGQVQGDFNTRDALVTLAHDCRRPELFQPQIMAALTLYDRGDFPNYLTGAWAGEIGMVQMLPADILENGIDGDGDGYVQLKTSAPDALNSGAALLRSLGWRPNEPWLQEVSVPQDLDWAQTGLDHRRPAADWQELGVQPRSGDLLAPELEAALILPMGRKGPAFLAYPNFDVLFEWNQSFTYVTTAAYLATRLMGAEVYTPGTPDQGLDGAQMKQLQTRLVALGHDVGGVDGILGKLTRDAVRKEQQRLGLPADGWPTPQLLSSL